MEHNLQQTLSLLTRTPATLQALLHGLPNEWTLQNEGENTWNVFDVVGHLVHCDRTDWMSRVKWILQFGESRPFEPLNRLGHRQESQGKQLDRILEEFVRVRSENLDALHVLNLQQENLDLRGQHPALGPVTLSQLLAAWAAHDLTHLHQISRIMAHPYRETVGPWSAYLGVLHCSGHGA